MRRSSVEILSGEVTHWNLGGLGVRYRYATSLSREHEVSEADFPILRQLEAEGKLTFVDDSARQEWLARR